MNSTCTFAMLAGPADATYFSLTLRHILKMCSFDFAEVLLIVDDLPKRGRSPEAEQAFCTMVEGLQHDGLIDRIVWLRRFHAQSLRAAPKYFGRRITQFRDHRGVPAFGWIAAIEAAKSEFLLYFDSDVLLYQSGTDWISAGMELIAKDETAMFVAPYPGAPAPDRELFGHSEPPVLDEQGNFRWKTFSSRRFLVSKPHLEKLLPTPPRFVSKKRELLSRIGIGNALLPWESAVSKALEQSPYSYVYLGSQAAWSLQLSRSWTRVGATVATDH